MAPYASAAMSAPPVGEHADTFLRDCLHGLAQSQKAIPCKWLYDEVGSALFERLCDAPEYYPSRTEVGLLAAAAPWLGTTLSPDTVLVEFGSGASRKTRMLLDAAPAITAYVPIDISETELARASRAIASDYPHIAVDPVLGDFTREITLPAAWRDHPRLGFFPGSTLGNFAIPDAVVFLESARHLLGPGNRLLLGVDVAKNPARLVAAYDDADGATAAFNRNLLTRMRRELACTVDPSAFTHRAVWNAAASRIEMHLVSRCDQTIMLDGRLFSFGRGETIHTENAHKLDRAAMTRLIAEAGWRIDRRWESADPSYDLLLLGC